MDKYHWYNRQAVVGFVDFDGHRWVSLAHYMTYHKIRALDYKSLADDIYAGRYDTYDPSRMLVIDQLVRSWLCSSGDKQMRLVKRDLNRRFKQLIPSNHVGIELQAILWIACQTRDTATGNTWIKQFRIDSKTEEKMKTFVSIIQKKDTLIDGRYVFFVTRRCRTILIKTFLHWIQQHPASPLTDFALYLQNPSDPLFKIVFPQHGELSLFKFLPQEPIVPTQDVLDPIIKDMETLETPYCLRCFRTKIKQCCVRCGYGYCSPKCHRLDWIMGGHDYCRNKEHRPLDRSNPPGHNIPRYQ